MKRMKVKKKKKKCDNVKVERLVMKLTKPVTKLTKSWRCVQRQTPRRRNSTQSTYMLVIESSQQLFIVCKGIYRHLFAPQRESCNIV